MSITSLIFPLFVFCTLAAYYVVPKKLQWTVLLVSSLVFYIATSTWGIIFVLITSLTVYGAAMWMTLIKQKKKEFFKEHRDSLSREEKKAINAKSNNKRKWIMIGTLIVNFGILCVFKYSHFAVDQLNGLLKFFGRAALNNEFSLISVLGISFYTFQSMGYVADVYWETVEPQRNYLKTLLFVSFFPQVTQGPISDYAQLSGELFAEHSFSYDGFARGCQRMVWGFFKKMVVADYLSPFVLDAFAHYNDYTGATCLLAAFGYSVQIYADFSGYMDIMCGICEMFGITLAENFERPYFSKSIAEYWRRWHITLGAWFKKYIYYPIGVSKWNRNLGKKSGERFGKFVGANLPATVALIAVWFVTGLWHGASWAYIAWGGVNGMFIIFSMWMEPVYEKTKAALHIREHSFLWKAFQTIRTFVLVTFIKVLPEVGTLKDGFGFWKRILTDHTMPTDFRALVPYCERSMRLGFFFVLCCVALLFAISLLQRKKPVRDYLNRLPYPVAAIVFSVLCIVIFVVGISASISGAFLYEHF